VQSWFRGSQKESCFRADGLAEEPRPALAGRLPRRVAPEHLLFRLPVGSIGKLLSLAVGFQVSTPCVLLL